MTNILTKDEISSIETILDKSWITGRDLLYTVRVLQCALTKACRYEEKQDSALPKEEFPKYWIEQAQKELANEST